MAEPAVMEALRRMAEAEQGWPWFQGVARAALSRPYSDEDVERVKRAIFGEPFADARRDADARAWAERAIRAFLNLEGER